MNELTTLTDAQLDKAIEDLKERELALKTPGGQKYIITYMRGLIFDLKQMGYRIEADDLALARLWAHGLSDEFIRLGEPGMKDAINYWAEQDTNEYRTFPQIPWIKEACKQVGGDPRVEKGRRVQAEAERQMELDHQKEVEELKKNHPKLWAMIEKKAAEMEKKHERDHTR